jgi:hypothetical protein
VFFENFFRRLDLWDGPWRFWIKIQAKVASIFLGVERARHSNVDVYLGLPSANPWVRIHLFVLYQDLGARVMYDDDPNDLTISFSDPITLETRAYHFCSVIDVIYQRELQLAFSVISSDHQNHIDDKLSRGFHNNNDIDCFVLEFLSFAENMHADLKIRSRCQIDEFLGKRNFGACTQWNQTIYIHPSGRWSVRVHSSPPSRPSKEARRRSSLGPKRATLMDHAHYPVKGGNDQSGKEPHVKCTKCGSATCGPGSKYTIGLLGKSAYQESTWGEMMEMLKERSNEVAKHCTFFCDIPIVDENDGAETIVAAGGAALSTPSTLLTSDRLMWAPSADSQGPTGNDKGGKGRRRGGKGCGRGGKGRGRGGKGRGGAPEIAITEAAPSSTSSGKGKGKSTNGRGRGKGSQGPVGTNGCGRGKGESQGLTCELSSPSRFHFDPGAVEFVPRGAVPPSQMSSSSSRPVGKGGKGQGGSVSRGGKGKGGKSTNSRGWDKGS